LAVLVGVAFFASLSGQPSTQSLASLPEPCHDKNKHCNAQNNDEAGPIYFIGSLTSRDKDEITAISTGFLAIITFGLVYVANRQHTTARAQLRAYVMVEGAKVINFGATPTVQVTLKNSGQTPAHDVSVWGSVDVAIYPLQEKADPPSTPPDQEGTIGSGSFIYWTGTPDRTLVRDEIDGVLSGEAALYVFGKALYKDVFRRDQTTEFCFAYGGPHRTPSGAMFQYKNWNKAT
jgi:hypothetical protein